MLLALSLAQASCRIVNTNPEDELNASLGLASEAVNSQFTVEAPPNWSTYQIGDGIGLQVKVVGEDEVSFTYDFGARIFTRVDDHWVELENSMRYPEGSIILSSRPQPTRKAQIVIVAPVIPADDTPITLRIILFGEIYRDGKRTGETTAASINVDLYPKPQPETPNGHKF